MNVNEVFGYKLRQLREDNKLTQTDLAKSLGVSRGAISYYENGERVPDIVFLDNVSMLFSVPLDYLLGYSENKNPEYIDIGLKTGLSDKAIDILENGFTDVTIINKIMESKNFENVINLISEYFNCEDSPELVPSSRLHEIRSYKKYVLTEHLASLLDDARAKYKFRNMTTSQAKDIITKSDQNLDKMRLDFEAMESEDNQKGEEQLKSVNDNQSEFDSVMKIIVQSRFNEGSD